MSKQFKRTLITTALPYANGPVHIGHLAGVYVPADIYARYLRLKGEEVVMNMVFPLQLELKRRVSLLKMLLTVITQLLKMGLSA